MDSNLKWSAILITVLICLTILAVVLMVNSGQISRGNVSQSPESETVDISASTSLSQAYVPDSNGFVQIGDDTKAWQRDSSFFDTEESRYAALLFERMKTLSLKAVSVERNLRVQVLDYEGNPVEGVEFTVSVKNSSTGKVQKLTDVDRDGRIAADELEPGNYEIFLEYYGDYLVPGKPLTVTVKESVEYLMIEDISYEILNGSQANTSKDDLMEVSAVDMASADQSNYYTKGDDKTYGVDISGNNGEISWDKVYESGIRFVMLRAGYRGAESGEIIADAAFHDNAKAAFRAGLDVGAYFFSQAVTEVEAVEEASALLLWCSDLNITYPLVVRFDRAGGMGRADEITCEQRTLIAEAFCETVKNSGYVPEIYASTGWIDTNLDSKLFSKYNLWLADFAAAPTYEGWYDMWQYSSKGKVPGIEGTVNLSLVYNQ